MPVPKVHGVIRRRLLSENAAHRFAVRWSDANGEHEGVYIPRRDSGSLLNTMAGGGLSPASNTARGLS